MNGIRSIALFCSLLAVWPGRLASAVTPSPKTINVKHQNYINIKDWAAREQFTVRIDSQDKTALLTNKWSRIDLAFDSRRVELNGVGLWLSYPITARTGGVFIAERDITTLFEPLLHPRKNPPKKKIVLIAISPGHGGKDPGYESGEHQEKKFTLLLAKALQKEIQKAGIKAVMVRQGDEYFDPDSHAKIANKKKADLFVSVHFNSAPDAAAKGVEVYALTPAGAPPTNGAPDPSRRSPGNKNDELNVLLAYQIQKSLAKNLDMVDRGMRRAGFIVLREANMPGVLIEGGFMSNNADAKKIYSAEERQKLARAIFDGILSYKKLVERK